MAAICILRMPLNPNKPTECMGMENLAQSKTG